jgi:hypothetical protein
MNQKYSSMNQNIFCFDTNLYEKIEKESNYLINLTNDYLLNQMEIPNWLILYDKNMNKLNHPKKLSYSSIKKRLYQLRGLTRSLSLDSYYHIDSIDTTKKPMIYHHYHYTIVYHILSFLLLSSIFFYYILYPSIKVIIILFVSIFLFLFSLIV